MVEAPRSRRSHECFQLCKGLLDGIEVRTVGRQEAESCAGPFNRGLDLRLFVHRQVVEDDDVAGMQRRHKDLFDVREERRVINRAIEHGGSGEFVDAQPRHDRVRLPMAVRRIVAQPDAARTASVATQQISGDTGFVDEDVGARVVQRLRVLPAPPRRGDVRPSLLVGVYGFF